MENREKLDIITHTVFLLVHYISQIKATGHIKVKGSMSEEEMNSLKSLKTAHMVKLTGAFVQSAPDWSVFQGGGRGRGGGGVMLV